MKTFLVQLTTPALHVCHLVPGIAYEARWYKGRKGKKHGIVQIYTGYWSKPYILGEYIELIKMEPIKQYKQGA